MATKTKYSEVDAMAEIDSALSRIEAEAQRRVLDWAASKFHVPSPQPSAHQTGAPAKHQQQPATDIKGFVAQKHPDGFYERIACLVYHLEKSQGKSEIGRQDIVQANSDARLSKMTNSTVFVKHATHTYGYLTSLGKRKLALSARGEAVVDALPDRAAVEQALASNPFGRKAKTRRAKR